MREIKFRAWSNTQGAMYTINGLDWEINAGCTECKPSFITSMEAEVNHAGEYYDTIRKREICMTEDVVLMQYTGIKDKNGKEIYEGDIVKLEWANTQEHCPIIFNEGMFGYNTSFGTWSTVSTEGKDIVIGNIYENPELLEVKQ